MLYSNDIDLYEWLISDIYSLVVETSSVFRPVWLSKQVCLCIRILRSCGGSLA